MKNIILIRTSTVKQEVESQKKETIEYAKSFGAENIVIIGGVGASAIKLDDQYLFNIQQVYKLIDEGDVQCVYAWMIDRIGRNEEVLMQFKNYLIKHKVQLRIKNPSLFLFDDNGKVNNGMEIAFSLYATMAKQEMEVKQERFKRTRERKKRDGEFHGGKVLFGYRVENKHFVPDETNGKKVQDIFSMYIHQPVSCRYIAREYIKNGTFTISERNVEVFINRLLKNELYKGNTTYPRLIDDETFQCAQDKMANKRIHPKVRYQETQYYLYGLLFDRDPDNPTVFHRMRVKKSEVSYVSYTEKYSININFLDSMVIQILNNLFLKFDYGAMDRYKEEHIEALRGRKNSLIGQVEELEKKDIELDERYFSGTTIRNYDGLKKTIQLKINSFKSEIDSIDVQIVNLNNERYEPIDLYSLSDEERRGICMKYIKVVYATKMDYRNSMINIVTDLGEITVQYNRTTKCFTYTDKDEPQWQPIRIIRNIKGRERDYSNRRTQNL